MGLQQVIAAVLSACVVYHALDGDLQPEHVSRSVNQLLYNTAESLLLHLQCMSGHGLCSSDVVGHLSHAAGMFLCIHGMHCTCVPVLLSKAIAV